MKNVAITDELLYKLAAATPDVSCLIDETEFQNNTVALARLVRRSVYNQTIFMLAFGLQPHLPTNCFGASDSYYIDLPDNLKISSRLQDVFMDVNHRMIHLKDFLEDSAYPELGCVASCQQANQLFADATKWLINRLVKSEVINSQNDCVFDKRGNSLTFVPRKHFYVDEKIPA